VASGVNNAVSRIAGLLAVAVFGLVLLTSFNRDLDRRLVALSPTSAQRQEVDQERPRLAAAETRDRRVSRAVAESFVHGYRIVIWIAVGLALASTISASAFLSTIDESYE